MATNSELDLELGQDIEMLRLCCQKKLSRLSLVVIIIVNTDSNLLKPKKWEYKSCFLLR